MLLAGDTAGLHAGVVAGLGRFGHGDADRVQVDVGHGGDDGGLVEEWDRLEAAPCVSAPASAPGG